MDLVAHRHTLVLGRFLTVAMVAFALFRPHLCLAVPGRSQAVEDPTDPNPSGNEASFDELLDEAQVLLLSRRPIDARAKLQKALLLNPNDYRPHMLLGQYYLFDVGHFTLADRYIRTAEELFLKKYGNEFGGVVPSQSKAHATLLYLKAEAQLNLDKYNDSLKTLEKFGSLYWTDWFPGTKAWVLMKLKRIDEAVLVAQAGLMQNADARRTYNILGILQSVKGYRELSLRAFREAIKAELFSGSGSQVATPLNNAGEVYRELFKDELAEAAWLRATRLPDGCEHILPSLNLAILYIDEMRLLQAERVLKDFEACYAQHELREDSEHRALLALARGRIALRSGDVDEAISGLVRATEREQWFGKIGTNENDVRFAASIALANAFEAKAAVIHDTVYDDWENSIAETAQIPILKLRAWWLYRQARNMGISELDDLEDLSIRNTDTMVEYPTLGSVLAGFPESSFRRRMKRITDAEDRFQAKIFYKIYLAENLLRHGESQEAQKLLEESLPLLRPRDRLIKGHTLALLLQATSKNQSWLHRPTKAEQELDQQRREQLYDMLPSHIRYYHLSLPVSISSTADSAKGKKLMKSILSDLSIRLPDASAQGRERVQYVLQISEKQDGGKGHLFDLKFVEKASGLVRASYSGVVSEDGSGLAELVNKFTQMVFSHRMDPPPEPIAKLDLLEGLF